VPSTAKEAREGVVGVGTREGTGVEAEDALPPLTREGLDFS